MIETTIAISFQDIRVADDGMKDIQRSLKKGQLSDLVQESTIKNLAAININIAYRNLENAKLAHRLQVRGAEVYEQEPILPQSKSGPKHGIAALAAALAAGFVLLLFVFLRKVWQSAAQDAGSASKLAQIKSSLS